MTARSRYIIIAGWLEKDSHVLAISNHHQYLKFNNFFINTSRDTTTTGIHFLFVVQ